MHWTKNAITKEAREAGQWMRSSLKSPWDLLTPEQEAILRRELQSDRNPLYDFPRKR